MLPSPVTAPPGRRVLVVEDTRDIRELLVDLLESEGYLVTPCENGAQALDRLSADRFDVVLLDLMMPVMDGLQLLQTLKERGIAAPPVIAMSAFERFRRTACELGATTFIAKPVDIDRLLDTLAAHAGERLH